MSNFEFVTVLMSIVVGLGITRILSGFASLVENRQQIELDGVTIVWALNVLGYHLLFWWIVVNNWSDLPEWSFTEFGALFVYGVLIFFCASLIMPQTVPSGTNMKQRFETIRRPFFALWVLVVIAELTDSFLKGTAYVTGELGLPYLGFISSLTALAVAGIFVADRRYHYTAAILFFSLHAFWMMGWFWTI
ncbi:MAG: hypothetical protein AAF351_04285 [Pseudomonadota bacterium]